MSQLIPTGYKQTEVGVIPEDWAVKKIGDIAPLQRGFDLPSTQLKKGIYPVIYSNGILNYHSQYKVKGQGVITGRSGTIGKVTFINENYYPHNTTLWVTDFKDNEPKFIYYLYSHIGFEKFSTGSGVPTLNRNDVHVFQVPLPTKPEQTAIATVLTDVDALISALDNTIAKKRLIKQGAMQELLSGKKRLAGFSGEWEVKKLGDVFLISAGGDLDKNNFSQIQDDKYCFPIYSNSLSEKGLYGYSKNYTQDENTITVTARGTVGVANARNHKYSAIGRVIILNCIEKVNYFFVAEYINNFIQFANESTGVPQLTAPQISKYEITIPPIEEQTAIAQILSDMDKEIEALEKRRAKIFAIKQGMMQELLTGKIRLITNSNTGLTS